MAADKTFARMLSRRCWEKHAAHITLLDLRGRSEFCNFFLIMSARNPFHLDALREIALDLAAEKNLSVLGIEGTGESGWILIDIGDLVVHVFSDDMRTYYDLTQLWGDAKTEEWDEAQLFPRARRTPAGATKAGVKSIKSGGKITKTTQRKKKGE
jgi:ribosome-associated protein